MKENVTMQLGRNELCHCGSGKKYKKCCLNPKMKTIVQSQHTNLSPTKLVEARVAAFRTNNFGFIFDTFHPDSNFRLQFPNRDEYIRYGLSTLDSDYIIETCKVLSEEIDGQRARVLFYLKISYQGNHDEYFELSEFQHIEGSWLYVQSHKLPCSEFNDSHEQITMDHVEQGGICF
jgi:SEC-C motif-containing protein